MTREEAARHDAPTLPDDDAPPARWWVVGWVLVGCIGWLAVGSLVVLAVRRIWE